MADLCQSATATAIRQRQLARLLQSNWRWIQMFSLSVRAPFSIRRFLYTRNFSRSAQDRRVSVQPACPQAEPPARKARRRQQGETPGLGEQESLEVTPTKL